jgi:hypothetical protein
VRVLYIHKQYEGNPRDVYVVRGQQLAKAETFNIDVEDVRVFRMYIHRTPVSLRRGPARTSGKRWKWKGSDNPEQIELAHRHLSISAHRLS